MKRETEYGFTLTEVLIALLILSVTLLALSTLVVSAMRATAQGKEMTVATTLLQDKMEILKTANFNSLISGSDSFSSNNISYNRQWSISPLDNRKAITVTVNWTGRGSHNVNATTLRGE